MIFPLLDDQDNWLRDIHPSLQLKISPRARRIALRLDTSARVMNLVVPERFSKKKARQFAFEHQGWIREKLDELPQPIAFEHDAIIPVLGKNRRLDIHFDPAAKITTISMFDGVISVRTNQQDPTSRIIRFLKKEARATLSNLVREKAAEIERPVKAIQIRDTSSRWGSCGPDGRISLSWRLIFAPWEAMDYVVAHEVAHLVHLNHGKRFWALCAKLCDDYSGGKHWMRTQGNELMRYGI